MIELTTEAQQELKALGLKVQFQPNQQIWVLNIRGEQLFVVEPPDNKWPDVFIIRWFHYARAQEIISILQNIAMPAYFAQGCPTKILNDSYFSEGPRNIIEEATGKIAPQWVANGLRYSAMVAPMDIFAKMSTESLVSEITEKKLLTMRIFPTDADALDWLLSLPDDESQA